MMNNDRITYMFLLLIFLLLFAAMYFLLKSIAAYDPLEKFRTSVNRWEKKRVLGNGKEKRNPERFFDALDEQVEQAGLKRMFPKAATEAVLLFCIVEYVLIFHLVGKNMIVSFAAAGGAMLVNRLVLDALRYRNMKITEKHLLELLNLISDHSLVENEITLLLYRAGRSMPYPIGDALQKCHMDAKSNGDTQTALYELRRSINHPVFREIILLLELCGQSNNDYQSIINDCRNIVHRYLQEEQKKASVILQLLGEAAAFTIIALYTLAEMIKGFAADAGLQGGLSEFFLHTTAGQFTLAAYGILVLLMLRTILKFSERK